jgi:hypothetical protein
MPLSFGEQRKDAARSTIAPQHNVAFSGTSVHDQFKLLAKC